jgi:hypothetical protein
LAARWATELPEWQVVIGDHDAGEGLFNRSEALNRAGADAGRWDVAMIADADSFVGREQALAAAGWAGSTGRLTYAHSEFRYLSRQMSASVLDGFAGDWSPGVEWSLANTQSSMLAVSRALWDEVGGFDSRFDGWGMEDVAFASACETMGGVANRVPGSVWHLWHPPSNDPPSARAANKAHLDSYLTAHGDRTAMRAVLSETTRDSS